VTTTATDKAPTKPASRHRHALHTTGALHRDPVAFTHAMVTKRAWHIEYDPHITGSSALTLTEDEAAALRDTPTRWLG